MIEGIEWIEGVKGALIAWLELYPIFFGKVLPALLWLPCLAYAWSVGRLTRKVAMITAISLLPTVLFTFAASYMDSSNIGANGHPSGAHIVIVVIVLLVAYDGWRSDENDTGWRGWRERFATYAGLGYVTALVADFAFVAYEPYMTWRNIGGAGWRDGLLWDVFFTTLICACLAARYKRSSYKRSSYKRSSYKRSSYQRGRREIDPSIQLKKQ